MKENLKPSNLNDVIDAPYKGSLLNMNLHINGPITRMRYNDGTPGAKEHIDAERIISEMKTNTPENYNEKWSWSNGITRDYCYHIYTVYRRYKDININPDLNTEVYIDCSTIWPGLEGYCDCYMLNRQQGVLHIYELKTDPQHRPVKNNWQMLCYAAGLMEAFKDANITEIRLNINGREEEIFTSEQIQEKFNYMRKQLYYAKTYTITYTLKEVIKQVERAESRQEVIEALGKLRPMAIQLNLRLDEAYRKG